MTINPSGKDIFSVSTDFLGKQLTLEVNKVGFRSSASVLAKYGDTIVLGTVQLGNLPYSRNSGRRYNRNKVAFSGSGSIYTCRFTDITQPVEIKVSYNSLIN